MQERMNLTAVCLSLWMLFGAPFGALFGALGSQAGAHVVAQTSTQGAQAVVDADALLAQELERLVLMDLRLQPRPTPPDFVAAGLVLEMAQQWAPNDPELLRRRIETAQAAGQDLQVVRLNDALLKLDPRDTVAQLRAIASRLRQLQTVGERLAAIQRMVDTGSIDPAVRSRLALDSALLRRERGDEEGFARDLTLAIQLDATNKEAALLAWSRYSDRLGDATRLELLINLLYADPLDPAIHRLISLELIAAGSFEKAARFHNNAVELSRDSSSQQVPEWLMNEGVVLSWYIQGPEVVLQRLNAELAQRRAVAAAIIQQARERNLPTGDLVPPDEVRLSPTFGRERVIAAWLVGDDRTRASAASDLRFDIEKWSNELQDPRNRPAGVQAADIARQVALEASEIWAFTAWAETAPQLIEAQQTILRNRLGEDHPGHRRLEAYRQLRLGNTQAAVDQIRPLLSLGYVIDEAALATGLERLGQIDEAVELYRGIALRNPVRAVGAWARQRLISLDKPDVFASSERSRLDQLADSIPFWIDRMIRDPSLYLRFRVDAVESDSMMALEPARIRLRLENISSIPLGVGPGRSIVGTVLLSPKLTLGLSEQFTMAQPEVVSLERRLRLVPGESIEAVVRADAGLMGWAAASGSAGTVRANWRALHGFSIGAADGIARKSVTGLESGTGALVWSPLGAAAQPLGSLNDRIERASPSEFPELVASARAIVVTHARSNMIADNRTQIERLASLLAQRLPELPQRERMLTIAMMPHAGLVPGLEELDRASLASTDPQAAALAMLTRVTNAEHPVVVAWADQQEPSVARLMATSLQEAIAYGRTSGYAFSGPTTESLAPKREILSATAP